MDLRHFAKILVTQGDACGHTRQDFEREISKRAAETRQEGESEAQAFTRVITEDDEGRLLFKAAMKAPPVGNAPIQAPQDFVPEMKNFGPAGKKLNELAAEMGRAKNISIPQSFKVLLSDPKHAEMVEASKKEARRATEAVTRQRWPTRNAEKESKTREWLNAR